MIIKNSFPNSTERERMKTLEKFEELYDGNQQGVLQLHEIIRKQYRNVSDIVYLGHGIPAKVSDFYGDFVQGDIDKMTLDYVDDDSNVSTFEEIVNNNNIPEKINDWATQQSISGYTVLLGYVQNNNFYIQEVDPDQHFPQSDGSVIFATYFRDTRNINNAVEESDGDLLLYTQLYELDETGVVITRQVWSTEIDGKALNDLGEETLMHFFGAPSNEKIEGLTMLPIVQIDNGRRTRWGFGKSDYHDITPQLAEVNERRTHIATQLLKNLDAKIELPEKEELKNQDGSLAYFEYIMRADKEEPETRYILNENPLIADTEVHITSQLQMISYITDVPMWALLDSTAPERVESMKIKLFGAMRKTTRKRAKISGGIKKIIEIGFIMLNREMNGKIELEFSDILPNDELVDAQVEEIRVQSGTSSKRSAIKRLDSSTDEQVDKEMEEIKNETLDSGAVDSNNPPKI